MYGHYIYIDLHMHVWPIVLDSLVLLAFLQPVSKLIKQEVVCQDSCCYLEKNDGYLLHSIWMLAFPNVFVTFWNKTKAMSHCHSLRGFHVTSLYVLRHNTYCREQCWLCHVVTSIIFILMIMNIIYLKYYWYNVFLYSIYEKSINRNKIVYLIII